MNNYRIWFDFKTDDVWDVPIELPVNPQEITIAHPANPTNYDVEGIGEIIIPRLPKLRSFTFDSFFPRAGLYNPIANETKWYPPEWYVNLFRKIQATGEPFEITLERGSDDQYIYEDGKVVSTQTVDYYDIVMTAVILDFSITDKGGEPGDVYYTMTINEYRDASPRTLAEIEKEEYDDEGNITVQRMVEVPNRPPQKGAIVAGRNVEINGKVYITEDQLAEGWKKTKAVANQLNTVVSRVLPYASKIFPGLSQYNMHTVWVNGLGWVDKADCKMSETKGGLRTINRIRTLNV